MSGPFLPISSRHDGGIDIHIHSEGQPSNCQRGVTVSANEADWDDEDVEPPCSGCVYIPGQDSTRLIVFDSIGSNPGTVNATSATPPRCFNKVYMDVDFSIDLDPTKTYAESVRNTYLRASHCALARMVTLLNPMLQEHEVHLNIMNALVTGRRNYYRNQLRIFASWRCQRFTVLNAPAHAQQIVQDVQNEVIGNTASNDLYQQVFDIEKFPIIGRSEEPLRSQITAMFAAARGRNLAAFRAARTPVLDAIQGILDDIANAKQRFITSIP